jgi:hypothetical protein
MKTENERLKVIPGPRPTTAAPPATLGQPGTNLWRSIMSEYALRDSGGLTMLEQACIGIDRAAEAADTVAREGITIKTPSGLKEHPAAKTELMYRSFVVRTLAKLGLDVEPVRAKGRPTTAASWKGPLG